MFNKIFSFLDNKKDVSTIDLSLGYSRLEEFNNYLKTANYSQFETEYEQLTWDAKTVLNEGIALNEQNAPLIEKWVNEVPDSYIAHLFAGVSKTCLAWVARTAATGNLVSHNRAVSFAEFLEQAQEHLLKADELNPNDAEICARMIRVCMGLGIDKSVTESYFEAAIELNPNHLMSHLMMINYLNPKWYGSLEEMKDFANEQVSTNDSSLLITLQLFAIVEEWLYYNMNEEKVKYKQFFSNKELEGYVQELYSKYIEQVDGNLMIPFVYNYFAFIFYKLNDKITAKQIIADKLHGKMTVYPWAYINVTSNKALQNLV